MDSRGTGGYARFTPEFRAGGDLRSRRTGVVLSVIAFLCGVLWVQQLPELPSLAWSVALAPLAWLAWRWPRVMLPPLFLFAGALWAVWRADLVLADFLPKELEGVDLQVEGRIADLPAPGEHGARFAFDIERAWSHDRIARLPRRVILSRYDYPAPLRVGDLWRFTVRLKQPHGFQNPGGFDYEAHLFQQRVRATGYVRNDPPPQRLSGLAGSGKLLPGYRLNRFRQRLSERIESLIPERRFTAMVTAFANGDDDSMPDDQWLVLNRTGTTHLVAISGMNIGLVAGLVFLLLRRLWAWPGWTVLRLPAPRLAAAGALLAATAYAALAGFAIPTQRALVMLTVALGSTLTGRRLASSTLLALALLAVLLFDPLAVLAPGFWLSFAAVAVILYAMQPRADPDRWHRLLAWGRVQWAVSLGALPILLFLFQQASAVGPIANLVAIPVIEIVVIPATLAGVAASLVLPDWLAGWPFLLANQALEWLWPALEFFARLPGGMWTQPAPPAWTLIAALIGILLLLAPRGFPARWLGAVWLLPLVTTRAVGPVSGAAWVTLLDVDQGLAVVVRTASHVLVYDTGARYSARFDAGRAVLVPFLRHAGIAAIDTLIVSHGDNDHIGGSASLLATVPVTRTLSSVPERLPGSETCAAGQHWSWDDVTFEILHPPPDSSLKGNNRCCVLRIASRYGRVLLPGDIGAKAERQLLLEHEGALAAEVLAIPHHGSRSSSTEPFVEAVHPQLALLPVGYRNRYHHPHPDVMQRYRRRGITVAASPEAGAIDVHLEPAGLSVHRFRDEHRRYWLDAGPDSYDRNTGSP